MKTVKWLLAIILLGGLVLLNRPYQMQEVEIAPASIFNIGQSRHCDYAISYAPVGWDAIRVRWQDAISTNIRGFAELTGFISRKSIAQMNDEFDKLAFHLRPPAYWLGVKEVCGYTSH